MANAEIWQEIDRLANLGYDPQRNQNKERLNSDEINKLCEDFGVPTDAHCGRVRERLAEECGFEFEQGYCTTPRGFNQKEMEKIIEEYKKRGLHE